MYNVKDITKVLGEYVAYICSYVIYSKKNVSFELTGLKISFTEYYLVIKPKQYKIYNILQAVWTLSFHFSLVILQRFFEI